MRFWIHLMWIGLRRDIDPFSGSHAIARDMYNGAKTFVFGILIRKNCTHFFNHMIKQSFWVIQVRTELEFQQEFFEEFSCHLLQWKDSHQKSLTTTNDENWIQGSNSSFLFSSQSEVRISSEEKTATKFLKNSLRIENYFFFCSEFFKVLKIGIKILGSEDFGSYLCKLDEIPKYPGFKKSLDPLLRTMTCFELCNFTGAHHYIHNNHIAANCNGFHAQFIRRSIDSAHLQIKIFASGVGILNLVKYLTHQIQKPISNA